jgi:hypothetical protein
MILASILSASSWHISMPLRLRSTCLMAQKRPAFEAWYDDHEEKQKLAAAVPPAISKTQPESIYTAAKVEQKPKHAKKAKRKAAANSTQTRQGVGELEF